MTLGDESTKINYLLYNDFFFFFSLPALFREATTEFTVDARSLTKKGGDHIKAQVRNPSGALTDCIVTDKADGTYGIEYTPFENGKK